MNPKSGKAGTAVDPADPTKALDADVADPGTVEEIKAEQIKSKSGKYGSVESQPHKEPATNEEKEKKTSWIEIKLVDEEGLPVPGERYRVTLPDETVAEGTLDGKGFARVDGFEPGGCKVTFPDLDKDSWKEK
jgi:hypothetical protein